MARFRRAERGRMVLQQVEGEARSDHVWPPTAQVCPTIDVTATMPLSFGRSELMGRPQVLKLSLEIRDWSGLCRHTRLIRAHDDLAVTIEDAKESTFPT